jgi:nitrogen regulatory protein PII
MNKEECKVYENVYFVVNYGVGTKLIQAAKRVGFTGGTILLGTGTVSSGILNFIGLHEVRKEIIMMIAEKELVDEFFYKLGAEFKLEKPNHGIAYTTRVKGIIGAGSCKYDAVEDKESEGSSMYNAITVIVDKGVAEDVIEAASKAGSKGGTIINARGSGIHETSKLFAMEIEPEKEMVLIISKATESDAIIEAVRNDVRIDEPGRGIIFVQSVSKTYGIRE